ncbi:MAG: lipoate--protein ligase [Clostridia bacterium]
MVNRSLDAFFNMATEEYLLTKCDDDVFLLWQNENAIVIGKNQNALAEIDSSYVKDNSITVVRRLTGGGAMYQDLGNINFTFITRCGTWFSDFSHFVRPVISALHALGIPAELSGRNDIEVCGRKISGNAQTVKNGRIMHHGTLLFNSNLEVLGKALRPDEEKIRARGIRSVSARVANINEFLKADISVSDIITAIHDALLELYPNTVDYTMTDEDIAGISSLADTRYRCWDWNYGESPRYSYAKKKRFPSGTVGVKLMVRDGRIESAAIEGDFFGISDVSLLANALVGVRHMREDVMHVLEKFKIDDYIMGAECLDLLDVILE